MKLVVTGGGTGGHVYPALEVGLHARERGWEARFFGSARGQERGACEKHAMPFHEFASGPVYRLTSYRGLKSLAALLRATKLVARSFGEWRPDVVFSTGGYSSAPVANAARKLRIPVVLHEQNSVPGRTNRMMGGYASAVCTVFNRTEGFFPQPKVVRTGMPIRQALRDSAQGKLPAIHPFRKAGPIVLVMGGSQGSEALNDAMLATALRMSDTPIQWLHLTGLGHFESTMHSLGNLGVTSDYTIKAYLDAEEMAMAMFSCDLAVCRSGAGTMSELAAFRKPSILVPYPFAFAQHQLYNAQEFESIGAAEVIAQTKLQPSLIEERIRAWLDHPERVRDAQQSLEKWDVPDSVERILGLLDKAAQARRIGK